MPEWVQTLKAIDLVFKAPNVPHVEVDHTVASTKLLGPYLDAHTLNYTNHQSFARICDQRYLTYK
jgi:hypothetical protein